MKKIIILMFVVVLVIGVVVNIVYVLDGLINF